MRKMLFLSSLLLLFLSVGCTMTSIQDPPTESVELAYEPLCFKSIDELITEKDRRIEEADDAADPQDLKRLGSIYQCSILPEKVMFCEYSVSKACVSSYYVFQNDDKVFLSSFSKTGLSESDLSLVALTVFRTYGKSGFDEFVSQNKETGKIIALGDISNLFYYSASYDGKLIQKNYDFMYLNKYMRISVPGNFSDDIVVSMINSIQRQDI